MLLGQMTDSGKKYIQTFSTFQTNFPSEFKIYIEK